MKKRVGETEYYFAIVLKESGKVIGEIGGYPEPSDSDAPSPSNNTFSPCWILNLNYQGHGYAYEAAYTFFDFLFRKRAHDESMPIRKIIIFNAKGCVKSSACVRKDCLRNSFLLSKLQTECQNMKILINMPS